MLAQPNNDGTLRRRLVTLEERLRGKTGTINGVAALSGIIAMPDGRYRYFSIMVNHHIGDGDEAVKIIDAIVERRNRGGPGFSPPAAGILPDALFERHSPLAQIAAGLEAAAEAGWKPGAPNQLPHEPLPEQSQALDLLLVVERERHRLLERVLLLLGVEDVVVEVRRAAR